MLLRQTSLIYFIVLFAPRWQSWHIAPVRQATSTWFLVRPLQILFPLRLHVLGDEGCLTVNVKMYGNIDILNDIVIYCLITYITFCLYLNTRFVVKVAAVVSLSRY
jgi:hypothetical protein